jgi:hypothetical protein
MSFDDDVIARAEGVFGPAHAPQQGDGRCFDLPDASLPPGAGARKKMYACGLAHSKLTTEPSNWISCFSSNGAEL